LNAAQGEQSFFEESQQATMDSGGSESPLLIFPFKVTTMKKKSGEDFTDKEKLELVKEDIKKFRAQLTCIMSAYMPIKDFKFDPYAGTGITKENFDKELLDNDQLHKVYTNYCNDFFKAMAGYMNNDALPVRVKLIRQSKDKHYATLPSRYLDTNPFIEPMEVPEKQSRLKFTKWEIENGMDNGTPVSQAAADPIPETTPEASASVFGAR
jgi:hypothetical protein